MGNLSLSVIIPCHNSARFIRDAVASVLGQTRPADEIIVIDDGSTDDLLYALAPFNSRLSYFYQDQRGVSAARNLGIMRAQGDVICFLDADDYYLPDKLEQQVGMFENRSTLGLVNSGWIVVDENGQELEHVTPWLDTPKLKLLDWLLWKPVLPGALIVRKDWLDRIGGFDEKLDHAEDVDLVLRLAHAGCKSAWLKAVTICYRQHGESATRSGLEQSRSIKRVLDKFYALPELPKRISHSKPRVYYHTLIWSSWQLLTKGSIEPAVQQFLHAITYSDLPAKDALMQGLVEYGQWLGSRESNPLLELFLESLREAPGLAQGQDSIEVLTIIDWWVSVWHAYVTQERSAARQALAAWKERLPVPQRRFAQIALMRKPVADTCRLVDVFWEDSRELGLVPREERFDVISLYLTVMTWSIYSRQWELALQAWVRGALSTRHPKAMIPWLKFIRAGIRYYLLGRRGRGEVLSILSGE